jgi:hypothetical protein
MQNKPGEVLVFTGDQIPSKQVECVLIYDEASGVNTSINREALGAYSPPQDIHPRKA